MSGILPIGRGANWGWALEGAGLSQCSDPGVGQDQAHSPPSVQPATSQGLALVVLMELPPGHR